MGGVGGCRDENRFRQVHLARDGLHGHIVKCIRTKHDGKRVPGQLLAREDIVDTITYRHIPLLGPLSFIRKLPDLTSLCNPVCALVEKKLMNARHALKSLS